ncbi:MAG: Fe-Mn family superoxide dismutase [Candidatus Jettenia sp. CY-1]|nr:twin-arginine translocation signal domain-containing protein [Candidatus Jettenia sp.]WKZ18967.1 MAG: Fe-Mn family superoxide dismutase [Candidatus Jettenia sp. CY-1]
MFNRREFLTASGVGGAALFLGNTSYLNAKTLEKETKSLPENYNAKDYSSLIGIDGFSENALKTHFTLYQGYVKNTNKLVNALSQILEDGNISSPEFAELKRRLGWEYNGMRLHEYYFENLTKNRTDIGKTLNKRLNDNFGSYSAWEKDFRAVGGMRGIGWAALYQDITNGKLVNFWIDEHNTNHLAGGNLILIMDVFEHAFMPDYGIKKTDYIEAFFKNINWSAAESRLANRPTSAEASMIK